MEISGRNKLIFEPLEMKKRIYLGAVILIIGFLAPLFIPIVLATDWSSTLKSFVSGALAFGIPEVFMLVSVAVMGKDGFAYLKRYLGLVIRRYGPPDSVGRTRHIIGVVMFIFPLVFSIVFPYIQDYLGFIKDNEILIMIILHCLLLSSLFVLGGDFWDKLRGLFLRKARINYDSP